MGDNVTFVDITKGFRRLGNFPSFSDEIFSSYADANAYAMDGPFGRSNAFCGQVVKVLPQNTDEEAMIYIIDRNYKLVSVTESITTDNKLTMSFGYDSESGGSAVTIVVPAGFVLNQISIRFDEAFVNDDAIVVGYRSVNTEESDAPVPIHFLVASGTDPEVENTYGTDSIIVSDEEGSEFTIQSMMTFTEKTAIILFIKTTSDPLRRGRGILKLN